jgi:hypothetical protein
MLAGACIGTFSVAPHHRVQHIIEMVVAIDGGVYIGGKLLTEHFAMRDWHLFFDGRRLDLRSFCLKQD